MRIVKNASRWNTHTHTYTNIYVKWVKWKLLSCVWLFMTPWTIQPMDFSRSEYWSVWPLPFPIQRWNPGLPHCRQTLYQLSHKRSPYIYIYSHACISLTFLNGLYHMTSALYPMNNLSYKAHLGHNWIKILLKNCKCLGLPWWSGGSDSTLPMQRAWVQSLVMELDPTCCT